MPWMESWNTNICPCTNLTPYKFFAGNKANFSPISSLKCVEFFAWRWIKILRKASKEHKSFPLVNIISAKFFTRPPVNIIARRFVCRSKSRNHTIGKSWLPAWGPSPSGAVAAFLFAGFTTPASRTGIAEQLNSLVRMVNAPSSLHHSLHRDVWQHVKQESCGTLAWPSLGPV